MSLEAKPLVIAGTTKLKGTTFLIIEVSTGGELQEVLEMPYSNVLSAIEKIEEVVNLYGYKPLELWTDHTDILRHSLSIVGIIAIAKHETVIQKIINRHIQRRAEVLAIWHELEEEDETNETSVEHHLWRRVLIAGLVKLRNNTDKLITKLQGETHNGK